RLHGEGDVVDDGGRAVALGYGFERDRGCGGIHAENTKAPRVRGAFSLRRVTVRLLIPLAAASLVLVLIVPEIQFRTLDVADGLQPVHRVGVVLDAVVQAGRVAFQVFLH